MPGGYLTDTAVFLLGDCAAVAQQTQQPYLNGETTQGSNVQFHDFDSPSSTSLSQITMYLRVLGYVQVKTVKRSRPS
jgi:hypothetical protein